MAGFRLAVLGILWCSLLTSCGGGSGAASSTVSASGENSGAQISFVPSQFLGDYTRMAGVSLTDMRCSVNPDLNIASTNKPVYLGVKVQITEASQDVLQGILTELFYSDSQCKELVASYPRAITFNVDALANIDGRDAIKVTLTQKLPQHITSAQSSANATEAITVEGITYPQAYFSADWVGKTLLHLDGSRLWLGDESALDTEAYPSTWLNAATLLKI